MRRLRRLLLGSAVVLLTACQTATQAAHADDPLRGAWEFVSGRYTEADGKVTEASSPELRSLKVLNDSRFTYITVLADGTFVRSAGGAYRIAGETYEEVIHSASAEVMRGKTYSFQWRIAGDLWHHTGDKDGVRLEEIWRRVSR